SFAPGATIFMVDADAHEMCKFDGRGISIASRIEASLSEFLAIACSRLSPNPRQEWADWKNRIATWKKTFAGEKSFIGERPVRAVDAYAFLDALSDTLAEDELIYVDTGGNLTWTCNGLRIKGRQSVFSAWN